MHYLTNTSSELEVTLDAGNADGAVTATVRDATGTQIATGAATLDENTAGRYTFALAPRADVATVTTTWSGTWDGVAQSFETVDEIVGTLLFTLGELRAFDDKKLSDTSAYPDALLAAERDAVTDFFEQVCNVSFVRRYQRDELDGAWQRNLWLMKRRPNKILSVACDGVAFSQDDIDALTLYESGRVYRSTPWPFNPVAPRNTVVAYEHGWQRPPLTIKRAALILARYELVASDIGDRTISVNTELGAVRLSVPGPNYPTGIPIVDKALEEHDSSSVIEAW
ncbi:MAG TPA: hypothetical protein VHD91_08475 [Gaiellaceae bacterium]|nr:hypothetical protein [Gaiellaceae bacterium]